MSKQKNIYELQLIDSAIDKMNKQKEELPQNKELHELEQKLSKLEAVLSNQSEMFAAASREQNKIEGELGLLIEKIKKEEGRLYSGTVSNPKELKAIQDEVEVLGRKRDQQETTLLESIEKVDTVGGTTLKFKRAQDDFKVSAVKMRQEIDGTTRDIEARLQIEKAKRPRAMEKIPADLLELYEQIRKEKHGVAVAKLEENTCLGCHLELPAHEAAAMTNLDDVWRCPHCRRILIKDF